MMKSLLWSGLLALAACANAQKLSELVTKEGRLLRAENAFVRITVMPQGGQLKELLFKPAGVQFAAAAGMGTEQDWKITSSREFLRQRPFVLSSSSAAGHCYVRSVGQHVGGGIDFLRSCKTYGIAGDSAVVTVDYELTNMPEAMSESVYSPQLHYHLQPSRGGAPLNCVTYLPLRAGLACQEEFSPVETSRDWMALADGKGHGLAVTMSDYGELDHVLAWKGNESQTLEYFVTPLKLGPSQSWRTRVEFIPFTGLTAVSGAGHGLVGELVAGKPGADGKTTVTMRVYSGHKGALEARVFLRQGKKKAYAEACRLQGEFPSVGTVLERRFEVKVAEDSLTELEVVLRLNGKKAARLNGSVTRGRPGRQWSLEPLGLKRPSSLQEMSLTQFTSIYPFKDSVPLGKPLAGGPLRVLSLVHHSAMPEVMYLGNHVDLRLSAPLLNPYKTGLSLISYVINEYYSGITVDRQIKDLQEELKKEHEVILVGGQYGWSCLPESIRQEILRQVQGGCGLVIVGSRYPTVDLTNSSGKASWESRVPVPQACDPSHVLVSGLPMSSFAKARMWNLTSRGRVLAQAGKFPFISELQLGKGRVVSLNYATGNNASIGFHRNGIGPQIGYDDLLAGSPHGMYYSLLGKSLLYASGRSLPVRFQSFAEGENLVWTLKSMRPIKGRCDIRVTNCFNELLREESVPLSLPMGQETAFRLPRPSEQYRGGVTVTLVLRDESGNALNWGSWKLCEAKELAFVSELKTDKTTYHDGESVVVTGRADRLREGMSLKIELVDSYERVLASRTVEGKERFTVAFRLDNQLPARHAVICARLLSDGKIIDTCKREIWLRPKDQLLRWDDFEIYTGWPGYLPLYLSPERNELYRREFCCTGLSAVENGRDTRYARHYNFLLIGGANGNYACGAWDPKEPAFVQEYRRTGNKMLLKNPHCLSDPKVIATSMAALKKTAQEGYDAGISVYMGSDETSLTGRWGKDIDYCFSEHCLARFRTWLKERYGSLARLNQAWQTSFKAMSEVMPFTIEEVRKSQGWHIAGWADHLEFMDTVWSEALGKVSQALKTYDPQTLFGQSGTPAPRAYGGMDWWKQMQAYDFCSGYDDGGQAEIRRSFKRPGYRGMTWAIGYAAKPNVQIPQLWRTLFMGYYGSNSFTTRSMSRPDWTIPENTRAYQPHMRRLIHGAGKYFLNLTREHAPMAVILYSQASIRAAFFREQVKEHTSSRLKFIALFRMLGLDFKFLSYEELAQGKLGRMDSVKLLALPDSEALSDAECQAIRSFVERGGAVMAEMSMPGQRDANCVPRSRSPLADLFTGKHPGVHWSAQPDSEFLNLLPAAHIASNARQIAERRDVVLGLLKGAGASLSPLPVQQTGDLLPNGEYFRYSDLKGNSLLCMLTTSNAKIHQMQGSTSSSQSVELVYRLPEKRHLYDLVESGYLGYGDVFKVTLSAVRPHALLSLPEVIAFGRLRSDGSAVSLEMTSAVDTVVRVRVFEPSGKERWEYARNQLVRDGRATWSVPFCLSDPSGRWRVRVQEVLSGKTLEVTLDK